MTEPGRLDGLCQDLPLRFLPLVQPIRGACPVGFSLVFVLTEYDTDNWSAKSRL